MIEIMWMPQHWSRFAWVLLVIGILSFLFHGDPDVHDLFKAWLAKQ